MAHRYKWNKGDILYTGCYSDGITKFLNDDIMNYDNIIKSYIKHDEDKIIKCGFDNVMYDNNGYIKESIVKIMDHCPEFNSLGQCIKCNYQYNEQDIESDKKKIDNVFFCS